jgi:hypothetical protein
MYLFEAEAEDIVLIVGPMHVCWRWPGEIKPGSLMRVVVASRTADDGGVVVAPVEGGRVETLDELVEVELV